MDHLVNELAAEVWSAVETGGAVNLEVPRLYAAISHRMLASGGSYDPETDRRVEYLRAVLRDLREGKRPSPDAVLHAIVGSLCGLTGPLISMKDMAAGAA